MMRVIYREELDSRLCRCGNPACGSKAATFVPACHPRAGLEAQYADGALTLRCRKCKDFVAIIGVGLEPDSLQLTA